MVAARAPVIIHAAPPWAERLVAGLLGSRALGIRQLAQRLTEADLARFPPAELAETEEHNDFLLDEQRGTASWRRAFAAIARTPGLDAGRVECLCCQRFILAHGRRISQLRQLLRIRDPEPVHVATDLPKDILDGLRREARWGTERIVLHSGLSAGLRALALVDDLAKLLRAHAAAAVRTLQMRASPQRVSSWRAKYAAWLGATRADLSDGGPALSSLVDFLSDAQSGGAVEELLIQGERPSGSLPAGVGWRAGRFPSRSRPPLRGVAGALLAQARLLAADLMRAADWRRRQLVAPVLASLPGTRLWFETDPPAAVLYSNGVIGGEPLAAALGAAAGVSTMMVFYSANVAYVAPPARARVPTDLEPEMRYIAAAKLAMWSPEMARAFRSAGYPESRLALTGVVHYGQQSAFPATRRTASAGPDTRVKIGLFDVSAQTPERRFLTGWGQTLYHSHFCREFFADIVAAARERWGEGYLLVRKLKRRLDPAVHAEDVDLSGLLPPAQLLTPPFNANLWQVLADLDLVICMPFTSVAFMAEQFGIAAAYYDPLGVAKRSSLGGRAPLMSGRSELRRWLERPTLHAEHDASVNVAAQTLRAACGLPWQGPRLAAGMEGEGGAWRGSR